MTTEQLNLIIVVAFTIALIAAAVIINIIGRKSLLKDHEQDFITDAIQKKKRHIEQTGGISFNTYIALLIGLPVVVGVLAWIFISNKMIALLLAMSMLFVPDTVSRMRRDRKDAEFESRYAKALNAFASCLKAKMTLLQAVEDVGNNPFVHETVREGFRQIGSDIRIGITAEEAFRKYAAEIGSLDAADLASAIAMQNVVGGGEAEIVESLAGNIQARTMMRREIKSLFAETKVLATFMDFAPFAVIIIMYAGAPQFVAPYFETGWMTLLLIGILGFTVIGSFIIRFQLIRAQKGGF